MAKIQIDIQRIEESLSALQKQKDTIKELESFLNQTERRLSHMKDKRLNDVLLELKRIEHDQQVLSERMYSKTNQLMKAKEIYLKIEEKNCQIVSELPEGKQNKEPAEKPFTFTIPLPFRKGVKPMPELPIRKYIIRYPGKVIRKNGRIMIPSGGWKEYRYFVHPFSRRIRHPIFLLDLIRLVFNGLAGR